MKVMILLMLCLVHTLFGKNKVYVHQKFTALPIVCPVVTWQGLL